MALTWLSPGYDTGMHPGAYTLLLATILFAVHPALAEQISGHVVGVSDGDTITVLDAAKMQRKVRLAAIDAPEKAQAFGERSKQNLSALVFGKDVRADCYKRDRYGRDVCRVWVTPSDCRSCGLTLDVALAQLTVGLAWHYKRFENEQTPEERGRYSFAEDEARARHIGLWKDPKATPPWEWRRTNATKASAAPQ